MKHILFIIGILLVLISCSMKPEDYTPEYCRSLGVNVLDYDTITGIIIEENQSYIDKVSTVCQSPFEMKHGCAIPVNEHEYVLWYTYGEVLDHERCHAYYETKEHI